MKKKNHKEQVKELIALICKQRDLKGQLISAVFEFIKTNDIEKLKEAALRAYLS